MSLLPMLYSNWWEDLEEPHRLLDQHFGVGLRPEQVPAITSSWFPSHYYGRSLPSSALQNYYRPWGPIFRTGDGGSSVVKPDKDQFKVVLDVQQFKPEEINVKVVDNCVVVEGKHEEKRDEHGWISRQFERRYLVPAQCNVDEVTTSLSSDGILTITAPRKEQAKVESERKIEIQHTGKPALENGPSKEQAQENSVDEQKEKIDAK